MSLPAARVFNSHAVASERTAIPPARYAKFAATSGRRPRKILEHLHYVEEKHV